MAGFDFKTLHFCITVLWKLSSSYHSCFTSKQPWFFTWKWKFLVELCWWFGKKQHENYRCK